MNMQPSHGPDEGLSAETPEDIAVLYAWANLQGPKFLEFSASHREGRAPLRDQAADGADQTELQARAAQRSAGEVEVRRAEALWESEDAARVAGTTATMTARRDEGGSADAYASAPRQAGPPASDDLRRGPSPVLPSGLQSGRMQSRAADPAVVSPSTAAADDCCLPAADLVRTGNFVEADGSGSMAARTRVGLAERETRQPGLPGSAENGSGIRSYDRGEEEVFVRGRSGASSSVTREVPLASTRNDEFDQDLPKNAFLTPESPAWLYENPVRPPDAQDRRSTTEPTTEDTLRYSRDRLASRWYALKGAIEPGKRGVARARMQNPALAVFSLAGGVGKTSLVATLGRVFSARGETVLLADTTSQGLLPYYFGADELRPGMKRTFTPPAGGPDAAIHLVSFETDQVSNPTAREQVTAELVQVCASSQRSLLDINAGSSWLLQGLACRSLVTLVPLTADMNSVIGLRAVERCFAGLLDEDGQAIVPYYFLNQYDKSLALHEDVRIVLQRQLGDRLLPQLIRRAPAVGEALAEGTTVIDYASDSPVAEDYRNLADWARSVASSPVGRSSRRSES